MGGNLRKNIRLHYELRHLGFWRNTTFEASVFFKELFCQNILLSTLRWCHQNKFPPDHKSASFLNFSLGTNKQWITQHWKRLNRFFLGKKRNSPCLIRASTTTNSGIDGSTFWDHFLIPTSWNEKKSGKNCTEGFKGKRTLRNTQTERQTASSHWYHSVILSGVQWILLWV